jgi:4a-hydroxytetrahydrobiopterin dehydratase
MMLSYRSCRSYRSGEPVLSEEAENELRTETPTWIIDRGGVHRLMKKFTFGSFREAMGFVKSVALIAEEEGHHPCLRIDYRTVFVESCTHAIHGLSENDFIMAAKVDDVYLTVTQPIVGAFESAAL